MTGQTNLQATLDQLHVSCDGVRYGFAAVQTVPEGLAPLGTFVEQEGRTLVASTDDLERAGVGYEGPLAKLTVEVHTSLELVGLTAALATKLTAEGISANVVAAFYHDHIFVSYEDRDRAIAALHELKS